MNGAVRRWVAAQWWKASGRLSKDREELYGGATGLRAITFHETRDNELAKMREVVEWCLDAFPMATPEQAAGLFDGTFRPGPLDRMLITFDDGLSSNYEAAAWLERKGVRAIFFVVPSLLDRSMEEYVQYHETRGRKAHRPMSAPGARGLSRTQVKEIAAMGHLIGAHNYAHRDLGKISDADDLRYEIDQSIEAVEELTGAPCHDFAIGFGQPRNVSDEAARHLIARCPRVYACHRGLNAPGITPRFALRHAYEPAYHPMAFTQVCLSGGGDRLQAPAIRTMLRRVGTLPPVGGLLPRAEVHGEQSSLRTAVVR